MKSSCLRQVGQTPGIEVTRMLVRKFMLWVGTVSAAERAEGAGALARAYLYGDFAETEKRDAEVALFSLLDDPSPIVRKSIAEAFASAVDAPHAIVLALANDQSAISSVVLGRSPLLCDADLIDCAAVGDAFAQAAITLRPLLSMSVSAALAEIGSREALIALAVNPGAEIADFSSRTITSASASTAKCAKRCSRADNYRRRCEARWCARPPTTT